MLWAVGFAGKPCRKTVTMIHNFCVQSLHSGIQIPTINRNCMNLCFDTLTTYSNSKTLACIVLRAAWVFDLFARLEDFGDFRDPTWSTPSLASKSSHKSTRKKWKFQWWSFTMFNSSVFLDPPTTAAFCLQLRGFQKLAAAGEQASLLEQLRPLQPMLLSRPGRWRTSWGFAWACFRNRFFVQYFVEGGVLLGFCEFFPRVSIFYSAFTFWIYLFAFRCHIPTRSNLSSLYCRTIRHKTPGILFKNWRLGPQTPCQS